MMPLCMAVVAEVRSDMTQFTNVPVRNASGIHLAHLAVFVDATSAADQAAYEKMLEVLLAVWGDEVIGTRV